jgi:hypothetical protein
MAKYRVNKRTNNPNNNHEVHVDTCIHYGLLNQYLELGDFVFCSTALQTARNLGFENVDGCKNCIPECRRG